MAEIKRGDTPRVWYRVSVQWMIVLIAVIASFLALISHILRIPEHERVATFHEMMSSFCEDEAKLMKQRADNCWGRTHPEAPWYSTDPLTEDLMCCPYPEDQPRNPSWAEQAMVWERARLKALRAAEWHREMFRYEAGSRLFPPRKHSGRN